VGLARKGALPAANILNCKDVKSFAASLKSRKQRSTRVRASTAKRRPWLEPMLSKLKRRRRRAYRRAP
jgi:hypothetical protein